LDSPIFVGGQSVLDRDENLRIADYVKVGADAIFKGEGFLGACSNSRKFSSELTLTVLIGCWQTWKSMSRQCRIAKIELVQGCTSFR
jgi:hypothetical protein